MARSSCVRVPPILLYCLISLVTSHPIDSSPILCSSALSSVPCIDPPVSTGIIEAGLSESLSKSSVAVYTDCLQQMGRKAQITIVTLSSLIIYVSVNSIVRATRPNAFVWYAEDREESSWIATSRSWFDRKSCRWLSICGAAHLQLAHEPYGHRDSAAWTEIPDDNDEDGAEPWHSYWSSGANQSEWDADEWAKREIPDYVFDYAPLVHLYSKEQYWPGDIAEHLYHTTPMLNYTPMQGQWDHPTLTDLDQLNEFDVKNVYLTSNDDPQSRPPWLEGEDNIPQSKGRKDSWADWDSRIDGRIPGDTPEDRAEWSDLSQPTEDREDQQDYQEDYQEDYMDDYDIKAALKEESLHAEEYLRQELRKRYGGKEIQQPLVQGGGGRSDAPAILLVMDKGNGVIDAFWFFFYSFNLGNTVMNVRFGNHVGDWEHCLVRFHHGKPKALFFSAHRAGEAYNYEAVEKIGRRPVIYSAEGSHAMYATPAVHPYILPWGLLHDITDRGPLWDPALNIHAYTYDYDTDILRASTANPESPTEWFYFRGHWGDKFYPLGDSRQYRFAGQYHYVNGPIGPRFKHLNRRKVCQGADTKPCVIRDWIGEGGRAQRWSSSGTGE
ncbi:hypothetical protein N7493_006640 [Penicillium malachiteum]|uniref:Vacuolar protein sorting-associated protein 62 n=1 Tax=Penicillium malachiteum TaxID=1324776 RepID=A0AAD6HKZ0_9EURO|nr:hypothetical protein N7493_006640 [Penicillium malachiteum]